MNITELHIENIKNIKVVDIKPEGSEVPITGYNGAGKTAALESIEMALTGKTIKNPIRHGEKKGIIIVKLGQFDNEELILKKTFTASGARLEVTTPDNSTPKKAPQKYLDAIKGKLCFDPLDFMNKKPNKQREMLLPFIDFDFEIHKAKYTKAYDARRDYNRDVNKYEIELEGYSDVDPKTSLKTISLESKLKQLDAMKQIRRFRADEEEIINGVDYEITSLKQNILKAQLKINELLADQVKRKSKLIKFPTYTFEQIAEVQEQINKTDGENAKVVRAIERSNIVKKLDDVRKNAESCEKILKGLDTAKLEAITNAEFPIPKLSVTEDTVTYNNIPVSQLSSAEQVKVAVGIAMALNPEIRVILIREGSLLDKKMYQAIIDLAKMKDYQVWVERVFSGDKSGIYFEEGEIADFPEED